MIRPFYVCVFAKPPRPGTVKTRLGLGAEHTASLARAFFQDIWAEVQSLRWARPVLATTGGTAADFGLAPDAAVWQQGDGDLGQRLERVLTRALRERGSAIAIGADSPGLPRRLLEHARGALASGEAVLGPCDDGGFYLLGLTRCPRGLLQDLPWSEPDTFVRTLERLHERDITTRVLEPWFDVDRTPDLERLHGLIEAGVIVAPHTARALAGLGHVVGRGRALLRAS